MIETKTDLFSLFHYWLVSKTLTCSLKVVNVLTDQTACKVSISTFGDDTCFTAIQDSTQITF